ncbi:MAG: hypothetical protein KIT31_20205 [Deltaproteobacteria bacterium]|nr:hypothetical protein [Deltaproteobacteria bacterium]
MPKTSDPEHGTAAASGSFYAKDGKPAEAKPVPPPPPPRAGSRTGPPPPPPAARLRTPTKAPSAAVGAAVVGALRVPDAAARANPAPPAVTPGGTPTGPKPVLPDEPAPLDITDRLPLRPDATDISGPPQAMPPPLPPPPPARAQVEADPPTTSVDDEPRRAVPVGEFDDGGTVLDKDKLRIAYEQATMVRDAANALLGLPEQPLTVVKEPPIELLLHETAESVRGDPTDSAPATQKFERGDPTLGDRADPTTLSPSGPVATPHGKLRTGAALRRKRGLGGDVRYVATVLFGVRRARAELAQLEEQQGGRQTSRRRHLVTLGRSAVVADGFAHPALGPAREQLVGVEEERATHTGQVAAADAELQRVKRERDARMKQHATEVAAAESELAEIAKKSEPLEKERAAVGKRASELRDALRRIDAKITATEASLHAVKGKQDPAAIRAEIATLRADRKAVQRDEPRIAAELDALEPKLASLEARRAEIRATRARIDQGELDDQRRAEELLAAIGAKRKVVDRAAADSGALRDKILFELGERLYVDRPRDLSAHLAPIDAIDVDLGTSDRRIMELREILGSVDRAKLARGLAVVILAAGALTAIAVWVVLYGR